MTNNLNNLFGTNHGLDEKSISFLTNALQAANLPGFDYLEFKQSLNALSEMHFDEEMSFKSAFATATTVGLTKAKLLETANHYKAIIEKEKEKFDAALKNQQQERIDKKKEEQQKLSDKIIEHRATIMKLQEEMAAFEKTITVINKDIASDSEKLEQQKAKFEMAHTSTINQMNKDIDGIQKYIA